MSTPDSAVEKAAAGSFDERDFHEKLARRLFNETWTLLDKADRTPAEVDRMIHSAHASRLHWELVGSPQHLAVGEWQIARVYSVLGRREAALHHARSSLDLCRTHALAPFYTGCAHEAMARALRLAEDPEAGQHVEAARRIADTLTDPKEREVLEADLRDLETGGS